MLLKGICLQSSLQYNQPELYVSTAFFVASLRARSWKKDGFHAGIASVSGRFPVPRGVDAAPSRHAGTGPPPAPSLLRNVQSLRINF